MKPQVLISGSREGCPNYIRAVEQAGGEALPCYAEQPSAESYAGLILCGGGDVDDRYTGGVNPAPAEVDLDRDQAELALIRGFLAAGRPILGICRGHQILNLALGGTLILDLPSQIRPAHTGDSDQYHTVHSKESALVHQLYGPVCTVNSSHHQAVEQLAPGLTATQWSEDGVLEAFESDALPLWGVQWHPERLHGDNGTADGSLIFRAFLARCAGA